MPFVSISWRWASFLPYGVFFKAIAADFGGSRLGVAIGLTVTSTVGAVVAPYVGRALDKFPLRNVMGVGALFMAVGFCSFLCAE